MICSAVAAFISPEVPALIVNVPDRKRYAV